MILKSQRSTDNVVKETSKLRRGIQSMKRALGRKKRSPQAERPAPNTTTIEVKDFDVSVFEGLMRYIHCGVVAVDPRTVVGKGILISSL